MADSESPLGELGPVERGRGGEERETEREVNEQRLDKTRKEKGRMLERQRKKDGDREKQRHVWRQECPGLVKPIGGIGTYFGERKGQVGGTVE